MLIYAIKRIIMAIPTALIVSLLVFVMIRLIPGDPVVLMLGDGGDPAMVKEMRSSLGLDRSLPRQFASWSSKVLHGDLGNSVKTNEPVLDLIAEHFPVTAQIVLAATALSCLIALPAGLVAAWRQNRWPDLSIVTGAIMLVSVPSFWAGIMLIWLFGVKLNWLPTFGFQSMADGGWGALKYMVLPVIAITLTEIAVLTRMMRASTIDVLRLEYIAHARAKGLGEQRVMLKHAFPNAFGPALTVIGLVLGHLLSGAAVIETVFTLPGLGRLLVESIYARDYPVVQGCLLFVALLYVFVNLVIDLLYPLFDPRIKL
ncbi:MAG TPA: ABC transporter permease [Pseudoduganella sp.]